MKKIYKELREYTLYERRISLTKGAQLTELTRQYFTDVCNGKYEFLGKKAAKAIHKFSNGRFTVAELMGL